MRTNIILLSLLFCVLGKATAQNETIDISGNNTSSSYVTYNKYISIPEGKTTDVRMARYCYFSSTIAGKGTLNLYAGGERAYLGTEKGAAWPNWNSFTGDIHIHPYTENAPGAGFYGVVLAHGGKSFSVEDIEGGIKNGKVNISMQNNHVTLHDGATLCCEANTNGAGFRIGELNAEKNSSIIGYMKKNTRAAYFILGNLNTDAMLQGTIAPPSYSDTHPVGIIKEGTGCYSITGNNNYISGKLRVLNGKVLVMNDKTEARQKKLRGALGARPDDTDPIAYVFEKGTLGGNGNIAGTVDNYGTIAPGDGNIGTLTLSNYLTTSKKSNLFVRPASKLHFRIQSADSYDKIEVNGDVKYFNIGQDFSVSEQMPYVEIEIPEDADLKEGDEFVVLTAKNKNTQSGDWQFELRKPEHHTWEILEKEEVGQFQLVLRITSLKDQQTGGDTPSDDPEDHEQMGPLYDDGISDSDDQTTLRSYAQKNGKHIGTAISTWKNDITNENLAETKEIAAQFDMLVAENEMKFDALQPSRNSFSFGPADNLVNFAKRHNMIMRGHCLVWHSQVPEWLSSDGKKNDKNWSRTEALQIMKSHINSVMGHFKGKVSEWDVVNECLDDDQTNVRINPSGFDLRKQSVWQLAIGDDYIDSAFVYAHRADPQAKLYLNDYDVELQGKAKAEAFYNLAVRLKSNGIPIHGVGLQCHFSIGDVDSVKLEKTIKRFAEAGLECIITELDMGIPSTSQKNLEEQARNYRVITDIVLNNPNCPNLVIWGLKDNNSWRDSNPLLYNAALQRKSAWYAVRSALRHRTLVDTPVSQIQEDQPHDPQIIYDISGRQVDETALKRGIYIQNGRKVWVK